jgi:hypothetical protein
MKSTAAVTTIAIDLAKEAFQLALADENPPIITLYKTMPDTTSALAMHF